ncbi:MULTISPECIES: OmpP1/FadL family transporter [Sulfurimonas]|uniref:Outer membrane protein transport protein n=1 Tax=Sulfurimonas diazotrophicus TaxID=3131939 RepID=A0ABZ3HBH4_9BACT
MTRTIKLAVAAAMALGATSAFATNGDHLIGLGAKSRSMGGVSIGMPFGAESGINNPALLSSVKGTEISFGGTLFMPNVKYNANDGNGIQDSAADLNVIPEVSVGNKVGEHFYWGIGIWGTAGMGTDYRSENSQSTMNMVTALQLMQLGVPVAYEMNGLSVGFTPILQYGALDINYNAMGTTVGEGLAQDLKFTYNFGLSYNVGALTLGAVYRAEIPMKYKGQISGATGPFAGLGILPAPFGDELTQPAEIGVGFSFKITRDNTIAFDYKQVKWGDAKGYKDFNWKNTDVFAVGYQFEIDGYALRAGYNHGTQPIKEADGTTQAGAAINVFNLLGFPAVVEDHITAGASAPLTEQLSVDLALTYALETKVSFDTSALDGMGLTGPSNEVKHSQSGVTFQLTYDF